MNDMTPIPRHRQSPITIRSNIAAQLLRQLTRDGRSQAQVIEDALKREATVASPKLSRKDFIAEIRRIVEPAHGLPGKSYHELRSEMYDEDGLPI